MKNKINYILVLASHGLRMFLNLLVVKLIAVYTGPTGLAQLSNFMSLITLTSVISGGGINNAVTKYVAEYKKDTEKTSYFINSSILYGILFTIIYSSILLLFIKPLTIKLFNNTNYYWIIILLIFAQFFSFVAGLVMSVANGLEKQVKVNYLTITSYLLCIPIVFFLVSNYFMLGGMLSLLLTISVFGITSMIFIFNQKYVDIKIKLNFNKYNLNILFKYTLMLIASALLFPLNEFLMREAILSHSNSTIVGYWQALNKLSGAYIGFFAIILSSIYMPKIASLDNKNSIFTLVKKALLYTGIVFIFTALIILLLKKNIILILFSDKFLLLSDVLYWQFIGDFFRVCSYVIGFITVAKGLFKLYIFGELLQNILYYTSLKITLLQSSFSFENVVKSYSVAYFIYFLIVYIVYYSFIRYSKKVTI